MKILVAVDGSAYSLKAIEFVASRQTLIESKPDVQVLNVRWRLPAYPARIVGMPTVREYYADEAEEVLTPARRRLQKTGLNPTARFTVGPRPVKSAPQRTRTTLTWLCSVRMAIPH